MSSLMLINPAHRPKKRRSAAQKAATRRMLAARRSPSRAKRRRNPIANPIHAAHALHRRRTHHRRRNPASRGTGIGGMVMPVVQGATGAIAVNAIANLLPLPVSMKTGQMRHVTNAGIAIAFGILGRKFLGRAAARMAEGSLIVEATHAVSGMLANTMPSLAFHGVGALPDYSGMGAITEEISSQYYTPESFTTESALQGLSGVPEYV